MNIIFLSIFIFLFNLIIFVKFETISKNFIFFDKPDGVLKKHKKPTSLIGGLIILINTYLIIFFLKVLELDNFFDDRFIYFIITISTFFFLIGFIDDLKNLSPNKKLFWIIFAIGLSLYLYPEIRLNHIKISFLKSYIHFEYSFIFLIFCYALLSNSLNMFDGINLQLISFTIFIFLIFITKGFVSIFFFLLLICLIFLAILNYQNRVFLGDSGSYLISSIIGSVFIYQYDNLQNFYYGDEIFIILLIPAIDMLRLFIFRLLDKKNPFKGDLNHLHHLINNYTNNTNKTLMISAGLFILPYMLLINNFRTYNILFFTCLVYFCLITFLRFKNNK